MKFNHLFIGHVFGCAHVIRYCVTSAIWLVESHGCAINISLCNIHWYVDIFTTQTKNKNFILLKLNLLSQYILKYMYTRYLFTTVWYKYSIVVVVCRGTPDLALLVIHRRLRSLERPSNTSWLAVLHRLFHPCIYLYNRAIVCHFLHKY